VPSLSLIILYTSYSVFELNSSGIYLRVYYQRHLPDPLSSLEGESGFRTGFATMSALIIESVS